jgi:oxygen-independent coproporphyrinogen-3 oxidase
VNAIREARALYVHVPFCPVICPYCDFHKMRRNEALVEAYIERLEAEAAALGARLPAELDTIYLGGGTPSHLTDAELERVIGAVARAWEWPGRLETTLEADPLTFDGQRARRFAEMGFSRLSVGLQSTDGRTLRFLGRAHGHAAGLEAVASAAAAGTAVNADLIVGVPGSARDVGAELGSLVRAGASHVSVYSLTIEPHTPFARAGVRVDHDHDADEFDAAEAWLEAAGFVHYEVSNYALQGAESHHNWAYWRGEPYLALGPGATRFLPVTEQGHGAVGVRSTAPLMKGWLAGDAPSLGAAGSRERGETYSVSAGRWVEDVLMTGLRTREGVDLDAVGARAGIDAVGRYGPAVAALTERGLLRRSGTRLVASRRGLRLLNTVLGRLLDAEPAPA